MWNMWLWDLHSLFYDETDTSLWGCIAESGLKEIILYYVYELLGNE